jgi:hypothetical protein
LETFQTLVKQPKKLISELVMGWMEWQRWREPEFLKTWYEPYLDVSWYFHLEIQTGQSVLAPAEGDEKPHDPYFNKAKEYNSYYLPDHPGGFEYISKSPEPLDHTPATMTPISHILRFWMSSALLNIDSEVSQDCWSHSAGRYAVREPSSQQKIARIFLDKSWRDNHSGLGEFIVISVSFYPPRADVAFGAEPSPTPPYVMLIKWANRVAFRVQMCSDMINVRSWRNLKPRWKLITLA